MTQLQGTVSNISGKLPESTSKLSVGPRNRHGLLSSLDSGRSQWPMFFTVQRCDKDVRRSTDWRGGHSLDCAASQPWTQEVVDYQTLTVHLAGGCQLGDFETSYRHIGGSLGLGFEAGG